MSDCFPADGDPLSEFVPGQFRLSADLFAVISKIQLGLLRKYLIKLAFGRDPGVITHRTVCIVAHKRARKRHVTKQGVCLLPRALRSNSILHIWNELKHPSGRTHVIKTFRIQSLVLYMRLYVNRP